MGGGVSKERRLIIMSTSNPPCSPSLLLPLQTILPNTNTNTNITSLKQKHPPSSWSHTETLNLISLYQHIWYSLNRGHLKAHQWDHLSLLLSKHSPPSTKTPLQCRHKIEKLRKRYRVQCTKPDATSWEYFDFMLMLDRGQTIVLTNHNLVNPGLRNTLQITQKRNSIDTAEDVDVRKRNMLPSWRDRGFVSLVNTTSCNRVEVEEDEGFVRLAGSCHPYMIPRQTGVQNVYEAVNLPNFGEGNNVRDQKPEVYHESSESEEETDEGEIMAGEIKRFAERMLNLEERKVEMMRGMQLYMVEMEKRQTEMIRESRRKVANTITRAFGSRSKKMKIDLD